MARIGSPSWRPVSPLKRIGSPLRRSGSPTRITSSPIRPSTKVLFEGWTCDPESRVQNGTFSNSFRNDCAKLNPRGQINTFSKDVDIQPTIGTQEFQEIRTAEKAYNFHFVDPNEGVFSRSSIAHRPRVRLKVDGPLSSCPALCAPPRTVTPPKRSTTPPLNTQHNLRICPSTHAAARKISASFSGDFEQAHPPSAELTWALARSEHRRCRLQAEFLTLKAEHHELFLLQAGSPTASSPLCEIMGDESSNVCASVGHSQGLSPSATMSVVIHPKGFESSCTSSVSRWRGSRSKEGYVDELFEALPKSVGVDETLNCHSETWPLSDSSLQHSSVDGGGASSSSSIASVLQTLPSKIGSQIRTGFSRLQGEVKSLRLRHKQQQVISDQLLRRVASLDALEARLESLQEEKNSFTEWCSLRVKDGMFSPIEDMDSFAAAELTEAHYKALQLYEHRRMIHEDHLAEVIRSRAPRMDASQICEILCAKLYVAEKELCSLKHEEESLMKQLCNDQGRLAARESKSLTPLHSAELRLLQQKLKLMQIGEETQT